MKIGSIADLVYRMRDLDRPSSSTTLPRPNGPTLYLKVDDIDDFCGAVLAHGLAPSLEPRRNAPGGRSSS